MKNSKLEIIVTNYNSQFWLKKTLSTLKEEYLDKTKTEIKVTVVDNNSEDDSLSMLRKEFKWAEIIPLKENHGFAYANNRAIEKTSAEYVMLLNSDVEFTEQSNLDVLLDFMDSNPKTGIITPKIVFTNGELDAACHRGEPTPWASVTYMMGLEGTFPESRHFGQYHQFYKDLGSIHVTEAVSGAAMIVRTEAIKEVGLLDEQFFMYAEDLDWCKRFREAGWEIIYHPEVVVIHHKNKSGIKSSSQKIASKTRRYFYDTMIQYYDKHYREKYPAFLRSVLRYVLIVKKGAI